jgi:nucleoside-diphosphate-sugar epimerase
VYGNSERLPAREDELVEPLSPYATSKLAAEQAGQLYARLHGLETVALRVFNAYGPGQAASSPYAGVITHFIAALGAGRQPLIYGDGLQTRDFTFVGDVVEALWVAASAPAEAVAGQVFNVARGEATSLLALVAVLGELLGLEVRPQFEPARAGEARHSHADVDLLRERTGFQAATDLRAGLAATLAAFSTTPTH